MGCSSCGTATGGKPGGCKSNGGCSTGGCNRMNTYDWLRNMPMVDQESYCKVVEVSFNKGTRKDFFRNTTLQQFEKGDLIAVEGVSGFDVGEISLTGEIVRLQMKKRNVREENPEMKKVLRYASDRDLDLMKQNKAREPEAVIRSRAIAKQLKLDMKISQVEMQADGRKATFFYIADGRVDFRELIKVYASEFKVKVEMRQIGARQEAGKVGGIGSCGRELCCSTWLTDFKSVNTTMARYQNLSINQTKLSGQCGRLKCCLNYELDTYLDALQHFPNNCDTIQVAKGTAYLVKKDIFKNLMWYSIQGSTTQYPLAIDSVKRIKSQNQQGIVPEELETVEVTSNKPKEVEPEFVDVVGQISLRSLEKADRKRRHQQKAKQQGGGQRPSSEGGRPPQRQGGEGKQQQGNNPQQSRQQRPNPNQQQQRRSGGQGGQQQKPTNEGQQKSGGGNQQQPQQQRGQRPPRPQGGGNQSKPNNNNNKQTPPKEG